MTAARSAAWCSSCDATHAGPQCAPSSSPHASPPASEPALLFVADEDALAAAFRALVRDAAQRFCVRCLGTALDAGGACRVCVDAPRRCGAPAGGWAPVVTECVFVAPHLTTQGSDAPSAQQVPR